MSAILIRAFSILLLARSCLSSYLTNSQQQTVLLDLKTMLEKPPELDIWNTDIDICALSPTPAVMVVCENGYVTHLQIVGSRASPCFPPDNRHGGMLSTSFSSEELMVQLSKLTNLKALRLASLGIWGPLSSKLGCLINLKFLNLSSNYFFGMLPDQLTLINNLQILVMDDNLLNASLPHRWDGLRKLATLSLSNNRIIGTIPASIFTLQSLQILLLDNNLLYGGIPASISEAYALQAISVCNNGISGNLPDMRSLTSLLAFNIENNKIGPHFPLFSSELLYLTIGKNKFQGPIPAFIGKFKQLQQLNLSSNLFSGLPPASVFTLPSVKYLDLSQNNLSGHLPANLTLPSSLKTLDLSYNLLTGAVPAAMLASLAGGGNVSIQLQGNCFSTTLQSQNPSSFCKDAALVSHLNVTLPSWSALDSSSRKRIFLISGITGGVVGIGLACLILLVLIVRRIRGGQFCSRSGLSKGSSCARSKSSIAVPYELLSKARYISQTLKLGTLGSPFREFSMEELCKATTYFRESSLLGNGSSGKVFKGQLEDGSLVAIKRLNKDQLKSFSNLKARLEILGKCRHQHLVSLLGYNITNEEGAKASPQVCLVYEYISNGTLRTRLIGEAQDGSGWMQRLLVLIGVARGVHFLHSGVVPAIVENDLKTTNILFDQCLVPKVTDYGLVHAGNENYVNVRHMKGSSAVDKHRKKLCDKLDIYNYGLVLLEMLTGRPPTGDGKGGWKELGLIVSEEGPRLEAIDPRIVSGCSLQSLTTVVEITEKCLSPDPLLRPSMDDVLWNLQYALQVQGSTSNELGLQDGTLQGRYFGEPGSSNLSSEQNRRKESF